MKIFIILDNPGEEPHPENADEGECDLLLRAQLKHQEILYTAELDGIWTSGSGPTKSNMTSEILNNCRFVELKTTREFSLRKMSYSFRK